MKNSKKTPGSRLIKDDAYYFMLARAEKRPRLPQSNLPDSDLTFSPEEIKAAWDTMIIITGDDEQS